MDLPVEIIELILLNASFKDACKAKLISRQWRDASIDLFRRGTYKRKTLEERVQFILFKLQKEVKKSGKKDKILKEDLNKLLMQVLDAKVLHDMPAVVLNRNVAVSSIHLWMYAEDEIGLWDYFDKMIDKSDKVHIRSALLLPYLELGCKDLYQLNLELLDDALDSNTKLSIEVDPSKGGQPQNVENLTKVFKQYFDTLVPALRKMNKHTLGWLQHIHKKFGDINLIKVILVMNLLSPSILKQSADRDLHKKGPKGPKPEPLVRMRKYLYICKILSSAMLNNKHKEDFLRSADEFTAQVALQLDNVVEDLMAIDFDISSLFQPVDFSLKDIFEALNDMKEHENDKNKKAKLLM